MYVMKLTPKQQAFADYYIETGNATQSYIKAGYEAKGNSAEVNASRLLSNAKVSSYIAKVMTEKQNDRIASQDEVLSFLTAILRGEVTEQFAIGEGMGAQSLARKEVSPKDRVKAAELLGKRYALWVDKQQIEGGMVIFKGEDNLAD